MIESKFNSQLKQFKDFHKGQSAIIFATGPTIKQYSPFEGSEECIKIGLNRIYDYPQITEDLDYYYYGSHYYTDNAHKQKIDKICSEYPNITSLASAFEEGRSHEVIGRGNITPERALELGSIPFENNLSSFTNDISTYSTLGHSIVFPPLQHILYMGINKIYLVGCDGGFTSGVDSESQELLFWWKEFVEFKNKHYPKPQIISINPVSLKGWFHDAVVK
jgi:hypothetical protein|tara:strand:- start:801 stop:1460 length:660 start_codon:yes stop_codon:yes gene_type:complete